MVNNSDKGTAIHTPSTSNNKGNSNNAITKNTNVLKKDRMADTLPFEKAVKKLDAKMFNPVNKKLNEKIEKPYFASLKVSLSIGAKIAIIGSEKNSANINTNTDDIRMIYMLNLYTL